MSALGKRSSRSISLRKAAARLSLPEIHRVCRPLDVLTSPADREKLTFCSVQYSPNSFPHGTLHSPLLNILWSCGTSAWETVCSGRSKLREKRGHGNQNCCSGLISALERAADRILLHQQSMCVQSLAVVLISILSVCVKNCLPGIC